MNIPRKRYSVYETGTDRPIIIWGSALECAAALKIQLHSFYKQVTRMHRGEPPKGYEIITHDTKDEEDIIE